MWNRKKTKAGPDTSGAVAIAGALLIAGVTACDTAPPGVTSAAPEAHAVGNSTVDSVESSTQHLYLDPGYIHWPVDSSGFTNIQVCFRNLVEDDKGQKLTDDEAKAIKATVVYGLGKTWNIWTKVRLTGYGDCPKPDPVGWIVVDLHNSGGWGNTGCEPGGSNCLTNGHVIINLGMKGDSELDGASTTVHEFGHALGFHHEMDNPYGFRIEDGTPYCFDVPQKVDPDNGVHLTTYYDDISIMNYCNPRHMNGLSAGDIVGSQRQFGTSTAGPWLKAMAPLTSLIIY